MSRAMSISVSYQSHGVLLVIGKLETVREVVPQLPQIFKTVAITSGGKLEQQDTAQLVKSVPGSVVQVRGHLGRFVASAAGPEGLLDLGPLSPNENGCFDLVLDLNKHPLLDIEVPPMGYARTYGSSDKGSLKPKLERLAKLIGTVNKPRYFSFHAARCAHEAQGIMGCSQCLSACPAGAIHDEHGSITISPWLCRGCGSCALVCPTGAVAYARPSPKTTLISIAETLDKHRGQQLPPVLAIYAGDSVGKAIPDNIPALKVTAIGSVGMELWIAALALGASRVLIINSGLLPDTTARLLEEQIRQARSLLESLAEAPERIRSVDDPSRIDWQGLPNAWPPLPVSKLRRREHDKRRLLMTALGHLATNSTRQRTVVPVDDSAPFGTVDIQPSRCSLCMACTQLCPTAALHVEDGSLSFTEATCVQCHLCEQACPENALQLRRQLDPDALISFSRKTLMPAPEMFCCVECGQPFAPKSLVENSITHVQHHPMFQNDGKRLLEMCMECRQKSTLAMG